MIFIFITFVMFLFIYLSCLFNLSSLLHLSIFVFLTHFSRFSCSPFLPRQTYPYSKFYFDVGQRLNVFLLCQIDRIKCSKLFDQFYIFKINLSEMKMLVANDDICVSAQCGDYVVEDYPDHTYLSSEKFVPGQDEELERRICDNHKKHT